MKPIYFFVLILTLCIQACSLDTDFNLGDGYHQYGDGCNSNIFRSVNGSEPSGVIICGEITSVSIHDNFIVVYRIASEKAREGFDDQDLWQKQKGVDSNQYWIIEKTKGKVHGPLTLSEYSELRVQLHLAADLTVDTRRTNNSSRNTK